MPVEILFLSSSQCLERWWGNRPHNTKSWLHFGVWKVFPDVPITFWQERVAQQWSPLCRYRAFEYPHCDLLLKTADKSKVVNRLCNKLWDWQKLSLYESLHWGSWAQKKLTCETICEPSCSDTPVWQAGSLGNGMIPARKFLLRKRREKTYCVCVRSRYVY